MSIWISTNDSHPDPLRSHGSTEDIVAFGDDANSIRPDSFTLPRGLLQPTSRYDEQDGIPPVPQVPAQAFVFGSPQKRLTNTSQEWEVIPVRPPLRPTMSFGGVSGCSDYSMQKHCSVTIVDEEEPQPPRASAWKGPASFACLSLINFMCDISATAPSPALPYIASELGLIPAERLWIAGSFLLTSSLAQPLFMRLSSAVECKGLILSGLVLFTVGNIISALATNGTTLVLGRSIEGFGAGAITVLTQLASRQVVLPRRLQNVSALRLYWSGIAIGPLMGGAMAQYANWRTIFWLHTHVAVVALITIPFILPLPYFTAGATLRRMCRVDVPGWLLLSASLVPVLISISWAGSQCSWTSWHVLVPLVVGAISLVAWSLYNKHRSEPIIPVSIFHSKRAVVSCLGASCLGIMIMSIIYSIPTTLQKAGTSSILSATILMPWTLGLLIASLLASVFINQTRYHLFTSAAWALLTLTMGLMLLSNPLSNPAFFIPMGVICGLGLGSLLTTLGTSIESSASNDDETIHAIPLYLFFLTLGQSFGCIIAERNLWVVGCALAGVMVFLDLGLLLLQRRGLVI